MALASDMKERITLQRLSDATKTWPTLAIVWAAVDPQGEAGYRFRTRYRTDLRSRADLEPAMRVVYRGEVLDLADVVETVRHTELQLTASRRIIESEELETGARRVQAWPSA